MKKFKWLLCILVIPSFVNAGLLVEPYVGYSISENEWKVASIPVISEYNHAIIGGRLGYSVLGFSLGVTADMSLADFEVEQVSPASVGPYDEWSKTDLGAFVGYSFPILLRVYGAYYFSSSLEKTKDNDGDAENDVGDEWKGGGYAIGLGFTGLPIVALNLEYRKVTYDEQLNKPAGTTTTFPITASGVTYSEVEESSIILTLSAPFDF